MVKMLLRANNIEVKYQNNILVLKGVSFDLSEGKIITLIGANGAGKTTTLRAISGLLKTEVGEVTDGSIEFEGRRIDHMDPEAIAKMGILQAMEGRIVFEHLSVEENLRVVPSISDHGRTKRDFDKVYDYFPRLKEVKHQESGYLSGGEMQMLVIGSCMMAHPKILLLDEPSLGLSPLLVKEIFEILRRINEEERTAILLVEQNALAALSIAEYGYVMENGRIVLDGTMEKLRDNEDVKEFYFGLSKVGEKKSYRETKHYKRRKRWLG
jgi:branched-chain amino acid transport system ATP-binding protein